MVVSASTAGRPARCGFAWIGWSAGLAWGEVSRSSLVHSYYCNGTVIADVPQRLIRHLSDERAGATYVVLCGGRRRRLGVAIELMRWVWELPGGRPPEGASAAGRGWMGCDPGSLDVPLSDFLISVEEEDDDVPPIPRKSKGRSKRTLS